MSAAIEEIARELILTAKEFFVANGYGTTPLIVIIMAEKDSVIYASPEGVPPGTLWGEVGRMIKHSGLTPHTICIVMDTYALQIDGKDGDKDDAWRQATALHAGDLGRMFRAGDPRVVEQLSAQVMRTGEQIMLKLPYKYTPVDGWEWGEISDVAEGVSSDWDFDRLVAGLPKRSYKEMKEEADK